MEEIKSTMKGMEVDEDVSSSSFDYLLSMPLWTLSLEKIEEINNERVSLEKQIKTLDSKSAKDLWIEDLNIFTEKYQIYLENYIKNENSEYLKVAQKAKIKPMSLESITSITNVEA